MNFLLNKKYAQLDFDVVSIDEMDMIGGGCSGTITTTTSGGGSTTGGSGEVSAGWGPIGGNAEGHHEQSNDAQTTTTTFNFSDDVTSATVTAEGADITCSGNGEEGKATSNADDSAGDD